MLANIKKQENIISIYIEGLYWKILFEVLHKRTAIKFFDKLNNIKSIQRQRRARF